MFPCISRCHFWVLSQTRPEHLWEFSIHVLQYEWWFCYSVTTGMMLFKFFNVEINEIGINLNLEDSIESKQGQEVESVYV